MVYNIVLGRGEKDVKKYGIRGTAYIGRQYVQMGAVTSLSNPVYLDMNTTHVVFISGKRGSGKSYTMGVIAEGMADMDEEARKRLSIILLDTMGVYWTMKFPNHQDAELLKEWDMEPKALNIKIFTPVGYFKKAKEQGVPTDVAFSIKPSELDPEDWFVSFDISAGDPVGVFLERLILTLKESGKDYSIKDIITAIQADEHEDEHVKNTAVNRFIAADKWGVFSTEGTPLADLAVPGQVTVLDMSAYAILPEGWKIKCLVLGLVSKRLFVERMIQRKAEEFQSIHSAMHYFEEEKEEEEGRPLVWLVIDEAHEFLPLEGKTAASDSLISLLREGRQPGVSLILATQQPGKIHTDVMTQSDIFISHRLTAKLDVDALEAITPTYLRKGIGYQFDILPRVKGSALALDDVNERVYPMKIRPRFTWHGGSAPTVLKEKKKIFEF